MKSITVVVIVIIASCYPFAVFAADPPSSNVSTPATTSTSTTTIPTTKVTPSTETTTKPATTTTVPPPTTASTSTSTTSTTEKPTPTTSTVAPSTTTLAPSTTTTPAPDPSKSCRHFDFASFMGGIVLTIGSIAIGFVVHKIYKSKFDRNYHTL